MKRLILGFLIAGLFFITGFAQNITDKSSVLKSAQTSIGAIDNKDCDLPEIIYFRIKHIIINDEWTADITFEFIANNVEKYRLSQDCFDLGFGTDFTVNKENSEYTIENVEKSFTNYFNLYAINACNEESKPTEIVLDPITTGVETNPVDSVEIKVLAGSLVITNPLDRNLSLKVYSVQGVCLLNETIVSGSNEFNIQQWTDMVIVRIEDKGKMVVAKKMLTRLK